MTRAYALQIPIAFLFTACGPGGVGDTCTVDADCDTAATPPLYCDLSAPDANGDGVCAEVMATTGTPTGT